MKEEEEDFHGEHGLAVLLEVELITLFGLYASAQGKAEMFTLRCINADVQDALVCWLC